MKTLAKSKEALRQKPRLFRTDVVRGLAIPEDFGETVDRDGGDYKAGLIRGCSFITRGEALGHGLWIDAEFLQSVADAVQASERGIKSRFTHPSLSGDGLGKTLGRAKGGTIDGDSVRGELHLTKSSHRTPDGDLAGYAMDMADEDPGLFGMSIVYRPDLEAEDQFIVENGGFDEFESPDPLNVDNLPHARLAELHAIDTVDEPAANPDGLFHRGDKIAQEADAVAAYCLGLSSKRPTVTQFDIDPDRILGFARRFMKENGLEIVRKQEQPTMALKKLNAAKPGEAAPATNKPAAEPALADYALAKMKVAQIFGLAAEPAPAGEQPNKPAVPAEATADPAKKPDNEKEDEPNKPAETPPAAAPAATPTGQAAPAQQSKGPGAAFLSAFGAKGGVWFAEGKTFEEAQQLHTKEQAAEIERLKTDNERLQKLATAGRGEASPVSFQAEQTPDQKAKKQLATKVGDNLGKFAAGLRLPGRPSNN